MLVAAGSILWLSAIAIRFGPQLFDSVDKDIPVVSKFISAQSQPLAVFSAAQSNKSIFRSPPSTAFTKPKVSNKHFISLVLRGLPFLVAIRFPTRLSTSEPLPLTFLPTASSFNSALQSSLQNSDSPCTSSPPLHPPPCFSGPPSHMAS